MSEPLGIEELARERHEAARDAIYAFETVRTIERLVAERGITTVPELLAHLRAVKEEALRISAAADQAFEDAGGRP